MSLLKLGDAMLRSQNGFNSETFIADEGQRVFVLTNGSYQLGKKRLKISVQGLNQPDYAYEEIDTKTFRLSESVGEGTVVEAEWYEGVLPSAGGHSINHKKGGVDELKLSELAGYKEDFVYAPTASVNAFWNAPAMPATKEGMNGTPMKNAMGGYDPVQFLANTYDKLVEFDPEYVTKTSLGIDASNTYPIYKYVFEPKHYEKTIILSGGTHGNEYTASIWLAEFMRLITKEYKNDAHLTYMRRNVRVVVIPLINPWGFANSKRQNYNQVDLNRNSNYLWERFKNSPPPYTYYKGTAPDSEPETRIMNKLYESYPDAISYLDFHTIITVDAEHIVFTPRYVTNANQVFADVIQHLYKPGNRIVWGTSALPTFSNFAAVNYGFATANPEWRNGLYNSDIRGEVEMTAVMNYFGNIVLRMCSLKSKPSETVSTEPYGKILKYKNNGTSPITVYTPNEYRTILSSLHEFPVKRKGLLECDGWVVVSADKPMTVKVLPVLYQPFSPDFSWEDMQGDGDKTKVHADMATEITIPAGVQQPIPINSMINVYPTNIGIDNRVGNAKFRLRFMVDNGKLTVEGYQIKLKYTASDKGLNFEYHASTGNESLGDAGMIMKYPDTNTFTIEDYDD